MSHAVLWKQALDEGLPYIAVFEDDVLLGKGAEKFLAEDAWLKERFDPDSAFIVRLETMFATSRLTGRGGLLRTGPFRCWKANTGDGGLYYFPKGDAFLFGQVCRFAV